MWRFKLDDVVPIVRNKTHKLDSGWVIIATMGDSKNPRYLISKEDQKTGAKVGREVDQIEIEFAQRQARRESKTGAAVTVNLLPEEVAEAMQPTVIKRPAQ
ncbi:MAG: hypothetical protein CMI53_02235 [Parcubacteria group bacterium]|nr:hypothetical protein [Parcubacteria group bacterium]